MEIIVVLLLLGIFAALIIGLWLGARIGRLKQDRYWKEEIGKHRKDAVSRSRAVLSGQMSEQIAPYLPGFNFSPSECKFIGKPVDFICFNGLDNKQEKKIDEIVFIEVKSGKGKLSSFEKSVKDAVEDKRVRWEEYRIP